MMIIALLQTLTPPKKICKFNGWKMKPKKGELKEWTQKLKEWTHKVKDWTMKSYLLSENKI